MRPDLGGRVDDYFAGSAVPAAPASHPQAYAPAYQPTYQQPAYQQPYPQAPVWGVPAAPPTSSGQKALFVVVGAVVGLVVLGIMAAVAIPVFLNQRAKAQAAHTTVSVPAQVQGMPRMSDAVALQQEARLQALPGPGTHVAGSFGNGQMRVAVGAAHNWMSVGAQQSYLRGADLEARDQDVSMQVVSAGTLGGEMRCGRHTRLPMTICAWADPGSYGVVVVTGPATDPTGTAIAAREAFVHRT